MKRQVLSLISLLSLLLVAGSAIAQSNRVAAKVPFGFMVANRSLPAGAYSVQPLSARNDGELLLRSEDSSASMIAISNAAESHKPANKTKLVFNRYGDQYFLSEIWVEGATRGRQLPETSREKEVAKELAQNTARQRVEIVAGRPLLIEQLRGELMRKEGHTNAVPFFNNRILGPRCRRVRISRTTLLRERCRHTKKEQAGPARLTRIACGWAHLLFQRRTLARDDLPTIVGRRQERRSRDVALQKKNSFPAETPDGSVPPELGVWRLQLRPVFTIPATQIFVSPTTGLLSYQQTFTSGVFPANCCRFARRLPTGVGLIRSLVDWRPSYI